MKYCKRIIACMICCLMVCALMIPAYALDQSKTGDLTIEFRHDGSAVSGAEFEIYRVGDMDAKGLLTLTGAFGDYPVELNVQTDAEYQAAADTLWAYVQSDGLRVDLTAVTDAEGIARATGLEVGIYLVAAQPYEVDGGKYVSSPQLWTLPYRANTADGWTYSLTVSPKFEFVENPVEPVTVKVLKQWDDIGNEIARPASITVKLLCDGEVYDTVTLTAEDNWRCTWEELAPEHEWTVVEDPLENYTVTIEKEGITFVVKNSYVEPPTEPTETEPTEPEPTEPPKIPQTGMTWWPVPVLLLVGIGLIAVGVISRKKSHDDT